MNNIASNRSGCHMESGEHKLRMQLLPGSGLTGEALSRKALALLHDESEPISHKVFAVQSLARIKSPEAEDALIRIAQRRDIRLSFPALKSLAYIGTTRAFQALSAMRPIAIKSLQRQKDFTLLQIGYRLELPGTEKLLARLLADANIGSRVEEFRLKFQPMKPEHIARVLAQAPQAETGLPLSRKTGFTVEAGGEQFYFVFSSRLENHTAWREALQRRQIAGQLFRQVKHTTVVSQQYMALATPREDIVQLSFFRKNGELFLLANVTYDKKKNSFIISNVKEEKPRDVERTDIRLDEASVLTMNLSYIRRDKKKKAVPITDFK
jgi:hypothetical protein